MFNAAILTVSDKGSCGEREDKSGTVIRDYLEDKGCTVKCYEVVPDETAAITEKLAEWADAGTVDIILTTGGTGFTPRDVTPEATLSVVSRPTPGFGELMRMKTFEITPLSILSRGAAGIREKCLIINLPGSSKAVRECLDVIWPTLPHAVKMTKGTDTEHDIPDTESR